ncbi:O-antigen ligase family protein [Bdellovibrio sp. HCB337]|uniref:O-antigen ligase family protein n=1 Tax=Bdellovibrio sp. HCB337 TaxID=3394358 RepID=UPI0039A70939
MDFADFLIFSAGGWVLFSISKQKNDWKLLWPKTTGLGALWIVWLVIIALGLFNNNPVNKDTIEALLEFRWMLSFQVLCFTLAWIDWDDKKAQILMTILLGVVALSFGFYYFAEDPRAGGPFGHSMPFAHTYGMAFVFVAGFLLVGIKNMASWKYLALITTLATAIITSLSMTRGAWLGMLVGVVCISLLVGRRWYGLALTSCLIATFAMTLAISPVARERTLSTNTKVNESDNQRKALWLGNIEIAKDYPILGTGYSQNKKHLRAYFDKLNYPKDQFISHAHNQYIQLLAGTGILGLICYLIFLGVILHHTFMAFWKTDAKETLLKSITLGALGAQICFVVGSLTESNFSISKNRYLFLLISAMGISIYYRYILKENFQKYKTESPNG